MNKSYYYSYTYDHYDYDEEYMKILCNYNLTKYRLNSCSTYDINYEEILKPIHCLLKYLFKIILLNMNMTISKKIFIIVYFFKIMELNVQ